MSKALLVTIFSDASLKDRTVGIGWWFKSEKRTGSGSHTIAHFPHDINVAELYGILAATQDAVQAHPGEDLVLIVQCDNTGALGALLRAGCRMAKTSPLHVEPRKHLTTEEAIYLDAFKELVVNFPVWLKHVKGHKGNRCARSAVNSLTDRLSREARNKK